ncbi:N-acetylmuramoyl-L-alanine amidase, partial [uncultured Paraglaciecola sp.]|uniref:N-acetylmuramoyl-L-alanine amidase n=1 Tax=uncultured Paraglaciecola sp. TaxID=1765024 RepID=UPI0026318295
MQSAAAALNRLCDPAFEVSAHYLISAQGHITQLVDEEMRAWHAGVGSWCRQHDINSRSIGIEL